MDNKTCFVVMGFGKKTDFESGRVLDLDKSYRNIIKPAVEAAGLKCVRADVVVHSGLIDVPMYEQLLNADVVVADLSSSNKNAFYELGIRHALRPFTKIVVCENGIRAFPFDISHVAIRQYYHLGEDVGYDEVVRFRSLLTDAIKEIVGKNPRDNDSPVYTFLNGLTPPVIDVNAKEIADSLAAVSTIGKMPSKPVLHPSGKTHSILMQQVDEAQREKDWDTAKSLLTVIRQIMADELKKQLENAAVKISDPQEDPYILQRLAFVTYKSERPDELSALKEARDVLQVLHPETSNDSETIGIWGTIHKRLCELTKDTGLVDEAVRVYGRGFYIKNDYYNGINFAYMLNYRAILQEKPEEAVTDFILARRVRKEVLKICTQWITDNISSDSEAIPQGLHLDKSLYWIKATIAEAYLGLDLQEQEEKALQEAYSLAPETWMKETTGKQIAKLQHLLAVSPLRFVHEF